MTYAPRPNEFTAYFETVSPLPRPAAPRAGLLRRLLRDVFPSREQQVNREAAHLIARSGGRLTDDIERQITDRLITGAWGH